MSEIRPIRNLKGHTRTVNGLAISPDGRFLASCGGESPDLTVRIWDLGNGKNIATFDKHKGAVTSVSFLPNFNVVSGSFDELIKIWDPESGKELKSIKGTKWKINAVAATLDGDHIVCAASDEIIRIFEIAKGKLVNTLEDHDSAVLDLKMSIDGNFIVSGSKDTSAKIWDLNAGNLLRSLDNHSKEVTSIAISRNNQYVISGSRDRSIMVWDFGTGNLLRTLIGHEKGIIAVAISPDNKYIVSGAKDNTMKVWDLETGTMIISRANPGSEINDVLFTLDGANIITGHSDSKINVWDFKQLLLAGEAIIAERSDRERKRMENEERIAQMKAEAQATAQVTPEGGEKENIIIFLSYATADAPIFKIAALAEALTVKDEIDDVLYWQEDMHDNIIKFMSDNLAKCHLVLMFCTQKYLDSGPCTEEWTTAKMLNKPLIPVFINPDHIPPLVRSSLGYPFDTEDFRKNLDALYTLILKKTNRYGK